MADKRIYNFIKIVIYVLLITVVVFFLYSERNKLSVLTDVPRYKLLGLFAICFLPVFFNALSFKVDTSIFNLNMKLREWTGLSIINTFYNYIFPVHSGMAVRIGYMKKRYKFPVSSYISFLSGSYLVTFFVSALTATLLSLILLFLCDEFHLGFLYLSTGLLTCTIILFYFMWWLEPNYFKKKNRFTLFVQNSVNSFQFFKLNKNKVKYLILCKFLFLLSISLRLFVSYNVLGVHISYLKLLLTCSFFMFSMFISIVPGNLGVKEGIIGISTSIMGLSFEDAMLGAVLDRMVSMVIVFILGIMFHYLLFFGNKENG